MIKVVNFIGIDVAKATFDVALIVNLNREKVFYAQFENTPQGMKAFKKWIIDHIGTLDDTTVVCMEHTGIYNYPILDFLLQTPVLVWLEMALQIKSSIGIQQGKTDKMDAHRIVTYAYKERENIKVWKPASSVISDLHVLMAQRDRLITAINQLTVPVNELEAVGQNDQVKMLQEVQEAAVKHLEDALEKVEKQIQGKLKEDPQINQLYKYAVSVCGVGMVIAVKMLVYTQGFTRLTDPAKLASYCGVAPFAHESGSTVKKRSKTHFMANKDLKCVLSMGARSAMRHDPDIKAYAKRKAEEGKSYARIKTAVCNKLLKRVLSCVNNQKHYEKVRSINPEVPFAIA